MKLTIVGQDLWKKIGDSMDRVEARLRKTIAILEATKVDYAIVGGNAVRVWVAQVDPGAVRATNDVDVLIQPKDLEVVKTEMEKNGFRHRRVAGLDVFLEGKDDSVRNAVHVLFANQKVKEDDFEPNPSVEPTEIGDGVRTLPAERLVRMKLNSYRLKDRVHLIDMIQVGIITQDWISKYPSPLDERLKSLIDNPDQ